MTDPLDLELELECKYCDYEEVITVAEADYISWHNGKFAQDCFPYLTAGQRELMISNTCDDCWNRFFPDEDQRYTHYFYYSNNVNYTVTILAFHDLLCNTHAHFRLFYEKASSFI